MSVRTAGRFVVAYALALGAWVWGGGDLYTAALARVCAPVLAWTAPGDVTPATEVDGGTITVRYAGARAIPPQHLDAKTMHNNVPLTIALLVASPLPLRSHGTGALLALGVLGLSHVAHVVVCMHAHLVATNASIYQVADPEARLGLAAALANARHARRLVAVRTYLFFSAVVRRALPVLLWLALLAAPRTGRPDTA